MTTLEVAMLFVAVSFFGYGTSCFVSARMVREFERYRLAGYRSLTGALQLLAACGLIVGLQIPVIGGLAAAGLAFQMACGLGVRVRIGDAWYQCVPAASYMLFCGWIATRLL